MNYLVFDGIVENLKLTENNSDSKIEIENVLDHTKIKINCSHTAMKQNKAPCIGDIVAIWGHVTNEKKLTIECDGIKVLRKSHFNNCVNDTSMSDEQVKAYIQLIDKKMGKTSELLN
nr:hypothetical protein [Lactiplantibacillus plantarum]